MWIWIICLIVLVVCFVIAWRMMMNSYDLLPSEKKFNLFQSFSPSDISYHMETLRSIKAKMKSLEDKSDYFESQIQKLNQSMSGSSKSGNNNQFNPFVQALPKQDEDDWKELYYDENSKKEKLENELDVAQQEIEYLQESLEKSQHKSQEILSLEKEYQLRLQQIETLEKQVRELHQNLEHAQKHQEDLKSQLNREIQQKKQFEEAGNNYITLKSENEGLRRQISEMGMRQSEIEGKLLYMNQLESKVSAYEEEKTKMIADLELMLNQSKIHHQ